MTEQICILAHKTYIVGVLCCEQLTVTDFFYGCVNSINAIMFFLQTIRYNISKVLMAGLNVLENALCFVSCVVSFFIQCV